MIALTFWRGFLPDDISLRMTSPHLGHIGIRQFYRLEISNRDQGYVVGTGKEIVRNSSQLRLLRLDYEVELSRAADESMIRPPKLCGKF
jgi:hypothetical protein